MLPLSIETPNPKFYSGARIVLHMFQLGRATESPPARRPRL
jgi:hypothetical protein